MLRIYIIIEFINVMTFMIYIFIKRNLLIAKKQNQFLFITYILTNKIMKNQQNHLI